MKKKIWIEVNHDGPIIRDENGYGLFIDEIEKELGINMQEHDFDEYDSGFPCWIDTDDFKVKRQ
jgi:hypothetical protein